MGFLVQKITLIVVQFWTFSFYYVNYNFKPLLDLELTNDAQNCQKNNFIFLFEYCETLKL